jgi:hypothetical protein
MRALSKTFCDDLSRPDGLLFPIFERVKNDQTLMLAIRDKSINIYYRGGSILKVDEQRTGSYKAKFDENYGKSNRDFPIHINCQNDARVWTEAFPVLKDTMDRYFSHHSKLEREFQQVIARENNDSTISNESEYFISDIEFADTDLHARIDLLAIRWLANQRKNGSNCRAALIEMNYGDGALDGSAGLIKHLKDFDALISDRESYQSLLEMMESQFNQLDELGLLNFRRSSNETKVKLNAEDKPEVIFILANHNPRSTKLSSILADPEVIAYEQSPLFDLKFFVSNFAGYGLHSDCMLPLTQFRELLKSAKRDAQVEIS